MKKKLFITTKQTLIKDVIKDKNMEQQANIQRRIQRFSKEGGGCTVYKPSWLDNKEDFSFHMVQKGQNNARNYKFIAKYFDQYFQFFSIFISSEGLPKIFTNALIKKNRRNTHRAVNQERKAENSQALFYSRLFYKVL